MENELKARLEAGETILIDGATGTELERRDVPMVEDGWSAAAADTHPDILRQVHEDYIRLGAQVIIANTFSTARHDLEAMGRGDKFELLNTRAVELAVEARERQNAPHVKVAAGLATPHFSGRVPPLEEIRRNYADQAKLCAAAGADLIMLEMMNDKAAVPLIVEGAVATGLPVWFGFSCEVSNNGTIYMAEKDESARLDEFLAAVSFDQVDVVLVMHTLTEDVDTCLDMLKPHWSGPVGVYAHSGEYIPPNWHFVDMISPEDYADNAQRWLDRGVQVIGGCCGIGVEHIALLSERLTR